MNYLGFRRALAAENPRASGGFLLGSALEGGLVGLSNMLQQRRAEREDKARWQQEMDLRRQEFQARLAQAQSESDRQKTIDDFQRWKFSEEEKRRVEDEARKRAVDRAEYGYDVPGGSVQTPGPIGPTQTPNEQGFYGLQNYLQAPPQHIRGLKDYQQEAQDRRDQANATYQDRMAGAAERRASADETRAAREPKDPLERPIPYMATDPSTGYQGTLFYDPRTHETIVPPTPAQFQFGKAPPPKKAEGLFSSGLHTQATTPPTAPAAPVKTKLVYDPRTGDYVSVPAG